MTLIHKSSVSACALNVRGVLGCIGITLLFATLASGETLSSYGVWQWNGFARSSYVSGDSSSSSLLSSVPLSSSFSDTVVSESSMELATVGSLSGAAILSGVVYYDENGNGVRDTTDWAIRDAVVSLTLTNSTTVVTTVTDYNGAYSFKNLAAGDYTVTLLTPSTQPGTPAVGTITDAGGAAVSTGLGAASGQTSIAGIQLNDGYTGVNYDFGQLVYPTNVISKRMLTNNNPGVPHTPDGPTPGPPIPEPGTLALLVIAGLSVSGFARRRRN
jgi:hypothetical protein